MNESDAAFFKSEIHGMVATIGAKLEVCRLNGQISCGCHLVMAREELLKALRSFNPRIDERELTLNLEDAR